jgi:hypothetical protein
MARRCNHGNGDIGRSSWDVASRSNDTRCHDDTTADAGRAINPNGMDRPAMDRVE